MLDAINAAFAADPGLTFDSYIKSEKPRSISKDRLVRHMGEVTQPGIERVQQCARLLLGL